jgi:hypothetical protein
LIESKDFWSSPLAKAMPIHWEYREGRCIVINKETKEIICYRLKRARESLEDARDYFRS